jgi:hypothetical protein
MASREALISLQTGPKGEHIESETGEVTTEEVITIISPRLQPPTKKGLSILVINNLGIVHRCFCIKEFLDI